MNFSQYQNRVNIALEQLFSVTYLLQLASPIIRINVAYWLNNLKTYIFCFTILYGSNLFCQTFWVAAREIDRGPIQFIKPDGKLAFTLPSNEIPQLIKEVDPFGLGNFNTVDFSGGVIIVKNKNTAYFINKEGIKVSTIGDNIRYATPLINDFFMVYHNVSYGSVITYYDKNGKIAFGGRVFWEATSFQDGRAIVQEYNAKENWNEQTNDFQVINTKGESILNLSKTLIPNKIRNLGMNKFGAISLYTKENKTLYFDVENLKMVTNLRYEYPKDSVMLKKLNELADKKGIILNYEPFEKFTARTGVSKDSIKRGQLYLGKKFGYLVKFAPKPLDRVEIYKYDGTSVLDPNEEYYAIKDDYIITKTKTGASGNYRFRKIETLEFIGETAQTPFYIQDDYFIFGKKPGIMHTIAPPVKNSKGEVIWPRSNNATLRVSSIEAILANPDKVLSIKLQHINKNFSDTDFPLLPEVQEIYWEESTLNDISALIEKCPKLTNLYITNCPNLTTIFSSNKKSNLNYIFVSESPVIEKTIEEIIKMSPKLNTVRGIYNTYIITKYPDLNFEDILVLDVK